ncbi:hypothetical protein PEC18_30070 [Paucibacter sp. O1-1]|nr:hypothetical protein [Paucibacter sp. O1-1]MDA3829967.1 hypothetical protein [Paucibacter sp. O1-1]
MLVDVIYLRHDGAKLSREVVLAATPRRAVLRAHRMGSALTAQLLPVTDELIAPGTHIPALHDAQLQRLSGHDLVLIGREYVGMHHERRQVPQAWWCKLVPIG